MASLVLGAIGASLGAGFGGTILGLSGAAIGGMIGSTIGSIADSMIVASLMPGQRNEGARLDSLRVTSSTEGAVIPRLYGRMRLGGNIIWATDFTETVNTATSGGKGGGPKVTTTTYVYTASFAVGLTEQPITGIGRIWADGKPLDRTGVTMRWYRGSEAQTADPFIAAKMGAASTPAYRGLAYVVFEELDLTAFGNRLPQLSFEVFAPLADADTAEGQVQAVTLIPGAGEFAYATEVVKKTEAGVNSAENANALADTADMMVALDNLDAQLPAVGSVSLVVAWFGDDLRAGNCTIKPAVDLAVKATVPTWAVNGVAREAAPVISQIDGKPVYGGTPADFSVVQAIQEMKSRGLRVTFYPFLMMDIPPGNTLPNPYSDNAAGVGQPALPWRGRITCSPAAGYAGSVDQTAPAATQGAAFFGTATPADFSVVGTAVSWIGVLDWGFRRMILHYAHLCAAAGGVDAFLIGSEMVGLTTIRSDASTYPTVAALQALAADVSGILGAGVNVGYAGDWSEYFGHHPADGSGDVYFHLDPLWADANIDFVGIDNYMPLSDWRDGRDHLDAQTWPSIYDQAYLQSNIAGGEGFGWFYASLADRDSQTRTPITDGAYGKPWVFRPKDLHGWWSNLHYNRPAGVESGAATAWVAEGKPIWFTELGCPAVDRGTNQPNVFYDPKSSESALPWFSRGWRDDAIQRAYLEATFSYWGALANNPISNVYAEPMLNVANCAVWTWDARPYPFFPELTEVWADGANWRLGHWLTGRLGSGSLAALVRALCLRAGLAEAMTDVAGLVGSVEGYVITALESPRSSITMLAAHFGFDAVESEGIIRFVMRGQGPVATITPDAMVAAAQGDVMELTRGQETELPQALKWSIARSDEDYDAVIVEAQRITVTATRVVSESFPLAVPPEEAERQCRRALMEAWVGREAAVFKLPPSRLALDPTDVIRLEHDGRLTEFRLITVGDAGARTIDARRQDRMVYDLPMGTERPANLATPVSYGAPQVWFLDLPLLADSYPAHQPLLAADAQPWPGEMAVFRSPALDGFTLLTTLARRASVGVLAADFYSGPTSRFDNANTLLVDLASGAPVSVTDSALFAGSNVLAVETAAGVWEIVQAGTVTLVSAGRYQMTHLLRGQRGTEGAMGNPALAGARVVTLDGAIAALPIAAGDVGLPWNWRIGPASKPVSDASYLAAAFTPAGIGLRPFSVGHVAQPWQSARVPGDLTINWVRRSRALVADSWEAAEVPLAEESESYAVEILDGVTVKRTLTSSTPAALYTAAQQTADWGAALGPGAALAIRVFQVSQTYGRGVAEALTLNF